MTIDKLTANETCLLLLLKIKDKPTSQICFENFFQNDRIKWDEKCILHPMATKNTKLQVFQYKILDDILK